MRVAISTFQKASTTRAPSRSDLSKSEWGSKSKLDIPLTHV